MAAPDAPDFLVLAEVDNAAAMAGPLFERKFGHPMPNWPNDVIAFVRRGDGSLYPMSYAKFFPLGSVMLVGGCCTDGRAFDGLDAGQRAQLQGDRSAMVHLLRYGVRRFADRCDAYFGYCGDARAWPCSSTIPETPTGWILLSLVWP